MYVLDDTKLNSVLRLQQPMEVEFPLRQLVRLKLQTRGMIVLRQRLRSWQTRQTAIPNLKDKSVFVVLKA